MKKKLFRSLTLAAAAILLSVSVATAQTAKEAVEAFNLGVNANQEKNYPVALTQFLKAIEISDQVGAEAENIKVQAEGVVPSVQFNIGMGLYNQKKMEESITAMEKAKDFAIKYKDEKTQKKVEKVIPQFYNFLGNASLRDGQNEKAIENYGKAVALDPNYAKSYLGIGLANVKLGNLEKALESFDKTIEVGTATNKMDEVKDAQVSARDNSLVKAVAEQKNENHADACKYFALALKYDDKNTDAYLGYAISANKLLKFDEAIESINKALPLVETSSESIKAGYYFHLAAAYVGKSDNASACAAYKKASFGTYKEASEYQIKEVLKCQ
ncbi:tetratricopeptide repeat protein [Williamwhitmania taraxaci]|uniref:TPR repeat-containing protein n=1 Tax=Williamwhitmania taraxaci TaxID=1640674 RepID=A0A1G6RB67_9BACT|nr:tetratricopeptide repeat protein [Williamwhitmania taraxaci]SDD01870.1 TPR repeat-containing protein [Williamwhitmania taraxaci]